MSHGAHRPWGGCPESCPQSCPGRELDRFLRVQRLPRREWVVIPRPRPMLATAGARLRELPLGEWRFEPKLDGWRATVTVEGNRIAVRTRSGRDITRSVPELRELPR